VLQILDQVREQPPESPSKINVHTPRDLEIICLKCLEKDPRRRYFSAKALAEDLGHYVAGEPITARRAGAFERLCLWCKRNPSLAAALGSTAAALIAVAMFALLYGRAKAKHAREQIKAIRAIKAQAHDLTRSNEALEKSLRESHRRTAAFYFEQAQADFGSEKNREGMIRLAACWRAAVAADDPAWKHTAWGAMSALSRYTPYPRAIIVPDERVSDANFSPDGQSVFLEYQSGAMRLWDAVTGQPLEPLVKFDPHKARKLVFSADGRTVATLGEVPNSGSSSARSGGSVRSDQRDIRAWDVATGQAIGGPLRHERSIQNAMFSPDGRTLLIINLSSALLWNPVTGNTRLLEIAPNEPGNVLAPVTLCRAGCFSPDGRKVLVGADAGTVFLWDAFTAKLLTSILTHDPRE
jgi:hypothetical protein